VLHGVQQVTACQGFGVGAEVGHGALCHHAPAALTGAGADVDDVVGAADGVFVVLHHHQGVAALAELVQGIEQQGVVTRVQADGGFVQHVAHALQVAAQLRGQADALGFAAAEGGRAPVEGEVAQAHVFQKAQAVFDFGQQVAGNVGLAWGQAGVLAQALHPAAHVGHREAGHVSDGQPGKAHRPGLGVEAGAVAGGTGLVVAQVVQFGFGKALFAAFLVVVAHRIVQHPALFAGQGQAGAHAVGAPAVFAVVREQARVQLGVAGGANGAGAGGRKHRHLAHAGCRAACHHGWHQAVERVQHMHQPLAQRQGLGQLGAQPSFVFGDEHAVGQRQLDGVFLEAVNARKAVGGQEFAIDPQVCVAAQTRPVGQLGIDPFAVDHQRHQQANVLAPELLHQAGDDALSRLRQHGSAVVYAVLGAQLDVEQAQKVPDLGGGAHGAFAATPAQALLNGDRGRNAIDRVHLGPPRRLHDAAGVGVEAF